MKKKWLWALAALPLFGLPLVAQQVPGEAPSAQDTPEPVSSEPATPADERLSVDNSLSFPVDI
jgi:hypothetical protein